MQDTIWVTKDGREYLVSNMTTDHIFNCMKLIIRSKFKWRADKYERLKLELEIRSLVNK